MPSPAASYPRSNVPPGTVPLSQHERPAPHVEVSALQLVGAPVLLVASLCSGSKPIRPHATQQPRATTTTDPTIRVTAYPPLSLGAGVFANARSPRTSAHDLRDVARPARFRSTVQGTFLAARKIMVNMPTFLSRLVSHSGTTVERAAAVAPEIIAGLAAYLTPARRDFLADELPEELAAAVRRSDLLATPIEERILGPGINLGHAHELVASSCRALAEVLSIEAIDVLRSSVPAGLAVWLDPPTSALIDVPSRSTTLASGRPGSSHPISEARPDPTRPIR
jgi:hypothetical protein